MKLSLSRSKTDDARWLDETVENTLTDIAATLGSAHHTVELVVVDDQFITTINRDYRGANRPTNVISFSYLTETKPGFVGDDVAGEIYVSHETLEREAKEQGVEPQHLFLRLGVHGLLHVLGYEHASDEAAETMEGKERELLQEHLTATEIERIFA